MRAWISACLACLACAAIAAPDVARADVPDEIKVHVEGDAGLVVERRIEDTELWESVCTGACDRKLPYTGRYRVIGPGIRESLWIALLPPQHHALTLDVKAAYSAAWAGGIALVSLGAAVMFGGTVALAVGSSQRNEQFPCGFGGNCPSAPENHSMSIAGGMTLLVGALIVGGGISAVLLGSQSRVRQVATVTFTPRGLGVSF